MITREKPFLSLTAGDLMSRGVVTVPQGTTLRAAAQILLHEQISGVPVVDAAGRCVGILSATDFLHFWVKNHRKLEEKVSQHMTADPVRVPEDTPITQLARQMIDAHIHRVVVVDSDQVPVGVVSSTDVLAAVTYSSHLL
jgi:predicted transcriptional regulator